MQSFKYLPIMLASTGILIAAQAEGLTLAGNWTLRESTVTYKASHPMKTATGVSNKTRGKARCAAECEILLAVPVISFDSGDSNRDLHMLEATKGSLHPVISVRSRFKAVAQGKLAADLEIEFSGKKAVVKGVGLTLTSKDGLLQAEGSFTVKMTDFGVTRPSLFGMAIDDEVPVTFQSTWEKAK